MIIIDIDNTKSTIIVVEDNVEGCVGHKNEERQEFEFKRKTVEKKDISLHEFNNSDSISLKNSFGINDTYQTLITSMYNIDNIYNIDSIDRPDINFFLQFY